MQIRFMSRVRDQSFTLQYFPLTNPLTLAAFRALLERVEIVGPGSGRVPVSDAVPESPLVSSVTLTEAPLAVSSKGTPSEAVVTVVVLVVVVGVPPDTSKEKSVLKVSVVYAHSSHSASSPESSSSKEPSSNTQAERLLGETLASILTNSSLEAGTEVSPVPGRLVTVGLGSSKTVAVTRHLKIKKMNKTSREFRGEPSG